MVLALGSKLSHVYTQDESQDKLNGNRPFRKLLHDWWSKLNDENFVLKRFKKSLGCFPY